MAHSKPAPAWRAALVLVSFPFLSAAALAQVLEAPQEISLDLDGDGRPDRAVLTDPSNDGRLTLRIHFGASGKSAADIVKTAISEERILAFESREKGTLSLTTCTGCGAMKSTDTTLTLVFRNDTLLVGGYERSWDWNTHLADGDVKTVIGGCQIDFLTGQAFVDAGIDDMRPVAQRFKPILLRDWSEDTRPAICNF